VPVAHPYSGGTSTDQRGHPGANVPFAAPRATLATRWGARHGHTGQPHRHQVRSERMGAAGFLRVGQVAARPVDSPWLAIAWERRPKPASFWPRQGSGCVAIIGLFARPDGNYTPATLHGIDPLSTAKQLGPVWPVNARRACPVSSLEMQGHAAATATARLWPEQGLGWLLTRGHQPASARQLLQFPGS